MKERINALRGKMKNKKGFTLIELIVVIAVIGILVLLAAPKFLGYTKDAHVAAMKADVKTLSNAALVYNIDQETKSGADAWPVTEVTATTTGLGTEITGFEFDEAIMKDEYYRSLKNDLDKYFLVTTGENEGEVFHKEGVEDRNGTKWYGVDAKK